MLHFVLVIRTEEILCRFVPKRKKEKRCLWFSFRISFTFEKALRAGCVREFRVACAMEPCSSQRSTWHLCLLSTSCDRLTRICFWTVAQRSDSPSTLYSCFDRCRAINVTRLYDIRMPCFDSESTTLVRTLKPPRAGKRDWTISKSIFQGKWLF